MTALLIVVGVVTWLLLRESQNDADPQKTVPTPEPLKWTMELEELETNENDIIFMVELTFLATAIPSSEKNKYLEFKTTEADGWIF